MILKTGWDQALRFSNIRSIKLTNDDIMFICCQANLNCNYLLKVMFRCYEKHKPCATELKSTEVNYSLWIQITGDLAKTIWMDIGLSQILHKCLTAIIWPDRNHFWIIAKQISIHLHKHCWMKRICQISIIISAFIPLVVWICSLLIAFN